MIGGKPDFELRLEIEVFLIEISRGNRITPSRLLNRGFIKCSLLLRFRCLDQTSAVQLSHVIPGRPKILMNQERGKGCDCGMSPRQLK